MDRQHYGVDGQHQAVDGRRHRLWACCLRPQKRGCLLGTGTRGKGTKGWRLDRGYRPKKTGETVDRRQNNGNVKAVSPRHCAANRAPRNCCFNCRAGQSHKDNVRCTAVEEQPEAKEVQLSQPSSTSLLMISSGLTWGSSSTSLLLISPGTLWFHVCVSAWPAFLLLLSFPRVQCIPNKSVPTLRYTHEHLLSAVPWISEARLFVTS